MIRANQGHSISGVIEDLNLLRPIEDITKYSTIVHGTYYKNLPSILERGLSRMSRNHIHLLMLTPVMDLKQSIPGIRNSCQILIFVNVVKAVTTGSLKFFLSENNVVLTSGDNDGFLSKEFFEKIIERKTGKAIIFV
ncbi:hypothetical protein ACOME3_000317 [Neoechinorhynchus agilis]